MPANDNLRNLLPQVANELNKSCPFMLDSDTRLDNALVMPDNTFQYNYTLINCNKSDLNIHEFRNKIEPGIIYQVKTNPDMQLFRDNKTTMAYNYSDKTGLFVCKILIPYEIYFDPSIKRAIDVEEQEERKRRNIRAWNGLISWAPVGAIFGGLTGIVMGFKSCSNDNAPWNSFLVYGFYGVIIGAIIAGFIGFLTRTKLR